MFKVGDFTRPIELLRSEVVQNPVRKVRGAERIKKARHLLLPKGAAELRRGHIALSELLLG